MKRKKILIFAALCLIFLSFAAGCYLFYRKYTAPKTMREMMEQLYPHVSMSGMSDYAVFDYDGLMNRAHTVALVAPLDDLTKENTFGVSESGDRYYAIHSVREVQVIQYFKNEKNFGETFTMAEKCGLTDVQEIPTESGDIQVTGGLVMEENCYPMQKGNYYLVFLQHSGYGEPLSLSADNGTFNLSQLDLNGKPDVCLEALYRLDLLSLPASRSDNPDTLIAAFCASERLYGSADEEFASYLALDGWESISIDTEYTDLFMEATLWYRKTETGYLFRLGEFLYEYEE